ncbi:serine/threonine-protein kinase [Slackia piriformis]|nr:serine/threonine-protein kinase [Slackia piriformis]
MSIDDAYRIEQTLSRGPRGVTELVTIDGVGPFVRKKIPRALAQRAVWAALAGCSCPMLPRVQATYETPDWFAVVLEFIPGETLERTIERRGRLGIDESARIIADVCAAAGELHKRSIVHCDLAPANIIVGEDCARIIDFGNARAEYEPATRENAFGTWGFAAPEQHGFAPVDARSDVYSIGKLLSYVLTGVRPDDEHYEGLLRDSALVPSRLHAIIERACAFEPSARFQSVCELADALGNTDASTTANATNPDVGSAQEASAPGEDESRERGHETETAAAPSPTAAAAQHSAQPAPSPFPADRQTAQTARRNPRGRRLMALAIAAVSVVMIALGFGAARLLAPAADSDEASGALSHSGSSAASTPDAPAVPHDSQTIDGTGGARSSDGLPPSSTADAAVLEIVESGWSHDVHGLVSYAVGIRNNSADTTVAYPEVTITGYAADGTVMFSQPQGLMSIAPGETLYVGGPAGSGIAPTSVEFALSTPPDGNMQSVDPSRAVLTTSAVSIREGSFGTVVFSGDVSMSDGSAPSLTTGAMVTIVLRDSTGAMVYGATAFVDLPAPGESVPFACEVYSPPAYATAEAHAQFW